MDPLVNILIFEVIDALIEPELHTTINPFLWIATSLARRDFVPRIMGFSERVVDEFTSDDMHRHFGMMTDCFQRITKVLCQPLSRLYRGGCEAIFAEKKHWYFSGIWSTRKL